MHVASSSPTVPLVSPEAVPLVVSNFMANNPDLVAAEIGTYPSFEHQIKLAPDTIPVAVKTRPIPYATEGKVADAVHLLDSQGIWENADKRDWAHPWPRLLSQMGRSKSQQISLA